MDSAGIWCLCMYDVLYKYSTYKDPLNLFLYKHRGDNAFIPFDNREIILLPPDRARIFLGGYLCCISAQETSSTNFLEGL